MDVSEEGAWKDSFLKRRWWMRLYRFRKTWVLCDAGGRSEGFDISLDTG